MKGGQPLRARVRFSAEPLKGRYREVQPGVYVTSSVETHFDNALPRGYYTVTPPIPIVGQSLDLAFAMAAEGVGGLFSAEISPDGLLLPVGDVQQKLQVWDGREPLYMLQPDT